MTRANAYKILEVSPSCTDDEINRAFKKLAMKHHPDKGGSKENFNILMEAKTTLLTKKAVLDDIISGNGRTYKTQSYDELREHLLRERERQLREIERLNALRDRLNKFQPFVNTYEKTMRIKVVIWVAFILKLVICAAIGYANLALSIMTMLSVIFLLYISPYIARLHDKYQKLKLK